MSKFTKKLKDARNAFESEVEKYRQISNKSVIHNEKEKEITIILNLENNDIYKKYTNKTMLNDDIFEYINEMVESHKKNRREVYKVKLKINFIDEELLADKEKIQQLIKYHYASRLMALRKDIHMNNIISLIMLIVGFIILVIITLFRVYNINDIVCEILDIFAWVFVWEACDIFALTNLQNKFALKSNLSLYQIEFL